MAEGPTYLCQGPECPQVKQAKLELRLEVTRLLSDGVAPLVQRMETATTNMAVHAERLTVGARQFEEQKEAITMLEAFRNQSIGEKEKSSRTAKKWALGTSAAVAVLIKIAERAWG